MTVVLSANGDREPAAGNDSFEGRTANRRVELRIMLKPWAHELLSAQRHGPSYRWRRLRAVGMKVLGETGMRRDGHRRRVVLNAPPQLHVVP